MFWISELIEGRSDDARRTFMPTALGTDAYDGTNMVNGSIYPSLSKCDTVYVCFNYII